MHNPSPWKCVAGLVLAACIGTGCGRAKTGGKPTADTGRAWDAYRDRFLKTEFETFPDMAVYVGRHEFDGKLPDWSQAGLTRTVAWLHAARNEAAAFSGSSIDSPRSFEPTLYGRKRSPARSPRSRRISVPLSAGR